MKKAILHDLKIWRPKTWKYSQCFLTEISFHSWGLVLFKLSHSTTKKRNNDPLQANKHKKKAKELNTCCTNVSWELYVYLFVVTKFEVFAAMIFRLESSLVFLSYLSCRPRLSDHVLFPEWRRHISKAVLVLTLFLLVLLLMELKRDRFAVN